MAFARGGSAHAGLVLSGRGLTGAVEAAYGGEQAGFVPWPAQVAFKAAFAPGGLDPRQDAMFEDKPRNLVVPHPLGMRIVLVGPKAVAMEHIQH